MSRPHAEALLADCGAAGPGYPMQCQVGVDGGDVCCWRATPCSARWVRMGCVLLGGGEKESQRYGGMTP
jgi:hypothetical protein